MRPHARGMAVVGLLALAAGCQTCRPRVDAALRAAPAPAGPVSPAAAYPVACPDRLDLHVAGRPEWTGRYAVGPDGCIELDEVGPVRVEGLTTVQVADRVAAAGHLQPGQVRVGIAEYRSRQVFLFGMVDGPDRAVPYQGPETVVDLLRRAGGLPPGAEVEVHVVRPNVAAGRRPEVFTVDLEAILLRGDAASNVTLQPYDQVYVGETRRYSVLKFLPEWLHVRENRDDRADDKVTR